MTPMAFVTIQSHNLSITWQVLRHESFRLHSLVVCMQFIDMILPKWNLLIASLLHIKMFIRICLLKMLTNSWHWLSSPLRRLSQTSPPPSFRWHLQCRCFRFCLNNKLYWYVLVKQSLTYERNVRSCCSTLYVSMQNVVDKTKSQFISKGLLTSYTFLFGSNLVLKIVFIKFTRATTMTSHWIKRMIP